MKGSGKKILERLRASDEKTKIKVMIAATCVCMIAVIYVWLGCFNNIISSGLGQDSSAPSVSFSDFWAGVKNNASVFSNEASDAFGAVFQGSK